MSREQSNKILIGIIVGILLAALSLVVFGEHMTVVKVLGQFFLLALRMIVVPLVLASVIVGITRMGDVRKIGKIGVRTLLYYALTTALSVGLGIILVTFIQPGIGVSTLEAFIPENIEAKGDISWQDVVLSFLSSNIFKALANSEMLPIILFSIIFAGILTTMGEKGKPLIEFFESMNEAIMRLVHLVMYIAPIGIFGLVASRFAEAGGPSEWLDVLGVLGKYMGTVLLGLAIHGFITLPIICMIFGRRNPVTHFINMVPALLTAWSTASSAATLPLTFDCAENRSNLKPRATGFVLPLGATVNMDGTALYESVAAIFIAQAYGIELELTQVILIFITATLASIGAAAIPEAGLFMMVIVLQAVGLPLEGISLIIVVDWFLDRFRTAINVWGDSVGAAVIDKVITDDPELDIPLPDSQNSG